jgi:Meckel syndrome type 1 protein
MNTHDHHDDDSLPGEDDLKALYGSLPRKEPSPSLDQAVHRMAADAVRPAKRRARWPATAASVAVLVLAGGIGWRLHEQSPEREPTLMPNVAGGDAATSAAPAAPASAPETTAESGAKVASSLAPSAPAMAPHPHESIRSALKPRVLSPAPVARHAAPAPASAMQDQVMEASAPVPAPAPPAPPSAQAYAPSPLAQEARANGDTRHIMVAKRMAAPASAAAAPADSTAPNPADSPEQELDKIRQLFTLQRRDEALQRLSAFRQAHPDIPVPGDLLDQQTHHE